MPSPPEKLAEALTALQALQKAGRRVIQSGELSRAHRERLPSGSDERLADFLEPWCARGRQHAVVRVLLGILRALLQRALRRRMASLAGTVASASRGKHGDPEAGCGLQPKGHEPQSRTAFRNVPVRP